MKILSSQNSKNEDEARVKERAKKTQKIADFNYSEAIQGYWERAKVPLRFHPEYFREKLEKAEKNNSENLRKWKEKKGIIKSAMGTGFTISLLGIRGTGKTQMSSCLIQEVCALQVECLYVTTRRFFMKIRETYRDSGPTEIEALKHYTDPFLLVLDEVGVRGETDWEDKTLIDLIDTRYGAMKDTLLMSNHTEEEFKEAVGLSVISRMSETGGIIECKWESFR